MNATIGILLIVLVVLLTVSTYAVSTPATKQNEVKRKPASERSSKPRAKKTTTIPAQPNAEERVSIIDQVLAETMKVQETKAAEPAPATEEKKAE
jgi:hypothetical protein